MRSECRSGTGPIPEGCRVTLLNSQGGLGTPQNTHRKLGGGRNKGGENTSIARGLGPPALVLLPTIPTPHSFL